MTASQIREHYNKWIAQVNENPGKFETTVKQMEIFMLTEIAAQLADLHTAFEHERRIVSLEKLFYDGKLRVQEPSIFERVFGRKR